MHMTEQTWKTAFLVLAAVVVVLLASGRLAGRALAQSEGGAGGVICVMGPERNGEAPIILVDVPDQTMVTYEYDYANGRVRLSSVRSFRYDSRLIDWQCEPPTVEDVRLYVTEQAAEAR